MKFNRSQQSVILLGDFNGQNEIQGSRKTNRKSKIIQEEKKTYDCTIIKPNISSTSNWCIPSHRFNTILSYHVRQLQLESA